MTLYSYTELCTKRRQIVSRILIPERQWLPELRAIHWELPSSTRFEFMI